MKINHPVPSPRTAQGAVASRINDELQLRRSVMACLLWEDAFYEEGVPIGERIAALIPKVEAGAVQRVAIEARNEMKLRHVPLLIVREMVCRASHRHLVARTPAEIIQRPDELAEFLSIYWKENAEEKSIRVIRQRWAVKEMKERSKPLVVVSVADIVAGNILVL